MHRRDLDWEGLYNVRDLGGHPLVGGGETRFGVYVRADNVDRLTVSGWQALVDYGVRTVVDLRFAGEREVDPPAHLPILSLHHPLLPDYDHPDWNELDAIALSAEPPESTRLVYLEWLERYRQRFGEALTAIASADGDACVLFHCMGGKDRTGLIAALVLSVAGVDREAIVSDYALSGDNLRPFVDAWIEAAENDDEWALRARAGATPAEAMRGVLDAVDRRWGGAARYLAAAGVPDALVDRLRERLAP